MFRFSQKLRTILRDLTSDEQAQLDRYDIELEDALSTAAATSDFWEDQPGAFPSPGVQIAAALLIKQILIQFGGASNINFYDDGAGGADTVINMDRDIIINPGNDLDSAIGRDLVITTGRNANITATGDINLSATGDIILGGLPTSDPGVPGAIYSVLGTLHISP